MRCSDDPRGLAGTTPRWNPARRSRSNSFHRDRLMEPWYGPAAIASPTGRWWGLPTRKGLRPARYWVTDRRLRLLASEVGVLDLDPASVVVKGRLQRDGCSLVNTAAGRIVSDDEIRHHLAAEHPYGTGWPRASSIWDLPPRDDADSQHALGRAA